MTIDLLRRGLKMSHLRLFSALSEHGTLTEAAASLTMTQPAVSRLISEAEKLVGTKLYNRTGRGIQLTQAGQQLAVRSTRILQEIWDAGRDIEELRQGISGRVKIGSVTGPAIEYVLPALRQIRLSYPSISLTVEIGTSDMLAPMLADGRLDFSLSRIPVDYDPALFSEVPQIDEPACMIARQGHPLARAQAPIPAARLLEYDWVLPPEGSPIRTTAERRLRSLGLTLPKHVLTTSSFLFTLATIRQTNAVAPIARSVALSFAADGDIGTGLALLPCNFDLSVETYSFLTRAGQILTPAAELVATEVRRTLGSAKPAIEKQIMAT
ncbi:LysR family transcriptional regulator [Roseibium sp.]|uniref:LysR family transcriptional regulator n=1 Tax=Roseibium sp. TaxID=1936156 RepID=UPI003A96CB94